MAKAPDISGAFIISGLIRAFAFTPVMKLPFRQYPGSV